MLERSLSLVAAITGVIAIFNLVLNLSVMKGSLIFLVMKIVGSFGIMSISVLTLGFTRFSMREFATPLLFVGMALLILGGFGAAWNIHMGLVTGDQEWPIFTVLLVLIGQGVLTILAAIRSKRPIFWRQLS
jgi:hypothetical protein